MTHRGRMIEVGSGDGARIGCYHVEPPGTRKAGLVLVMEIFGVTNHIKDLCDAYAAEGYEVLSPQLYDRIERDVTTGYSPEDVQRALAIRARNSYDNTTLDVQACIDVLKARGPVACVGFCYGGSVTWVAACRCSDLACASSYYGAAIKDFLEETPRCPIMLQFGEKDASIPMEVVDRLRAKHPRAIVHVYPGAEHGFQSDRPQHHSAEASRLARERTLAFFDWIMGD